MCDSSSRIDTHRSWHPSIWVDHAHLHICQVHMPLARAPLEQHYHAIFDNLFSVSHSHHLHKYQQLQLLYLSI